MSSTVEQIKERLGVVEVISQYLKLERAGINYKACCPFHQEKTPSFIVSPTRGSWHCFGCGKGGDIISFVEEIEGVDFVGALKVLAPQAGIELQVFNRQENEVEQRLYQLLEKAAAFFAAELGRQQGVQDYLAARGLKAETIKRFRLGFAPAGWRHVSDYLNAGGFSDVEIERAGLLVKPATGAGTKGSRFYERFRERVMFPLADPSGRIVGFTGRVFGESAAANASAKYVNTPETPLYQKSRLLYGFDEAKRFIRERGSAVLVEGQMDLLLAHQAGVTNAVAVSGTALTTDHLSRLRRLTENLIMSFDPDLAGVNASRRAIDLALGLGFEVRAALLPAGQDPAEVIKNDPAAFKQAITEAKHIIDFYLAVLRRAEHEPRELNKLVSREVLPYVRRLPNALDQDHFVKKIANFLNASAEAVWAEVRRAPAPVAGVSPPAEPVGGLSRIERMERLLFGLYLARGEEGIKNKLKNLLGEDFVPREARYRALGESLLFEVEMMFEGSAKLTEAADELLRDYEREKLKADLEATLVLLRQAEGSGDQASLDKYMKKCQDISKALNNLN